MVSGHFCVHVFACLCALARVQTSDALRLVPLGAGGLHPHPDRKFEKARGICEKSKPAPSATSSVPTASRRAAVVIWKESFRGFSGLPHFMRQGAPRKSPSCTPVAEEMQRALAANHLDKVIAPLEEHFKVDVFLFTQSCSTEMQRKLLSWYNRGRNRTVQHVFEEADSQYDRAATSAQELLAYFHNSAEAAAAQYSFVHFMRFDLVTEMSIATDSFLEQVDRSVFAADDVAITLPGWMMKCVLPPISEQCKDMELDSTRGVHPWYQCFTVNLDDVQFQSYDHPFFIYRGPVGYKFLGGPMARLCHMLHGQYGGPRCLAEDAAQLVCEYICPLGAWDGGIACLGTFWQRFFEERGFVSRFDETLEVGQQIHFCKP
uniref:Hexosyltransferase n=1 Tax=Alexandrium catenella TaxID=2925 RepID=A0A7S1L2L0_ALECA|eukprot:CAMPEP_0171190928 /NCGR_PEP_ID=MMETSP0790-20130122/19104_1 /TAXON_ID=2925 /ORGANISM="Alexandrium catenella, Strain OF101" /LENGTH=374 /DNA_ID=CAMNT_0011656065 /DNA_START=38 /DNA_END=1162 /DNA_ORIENTATION=+